MPVAPLHFVRDYFFCAPRHATSGLCLMRLGRVIHVRVEIALTFQTLANIALPFFKKVGVNRPLLIDRDQFFQFALRKTRARYGDLHARSFRHIQLQRNRVLRGVIVASANCRSPAEMPFLDQIFSNAVSPALQLSRRDVASRLHSQARTNLRISVLGFVL